MVSRYSCRSGSLAASFSRASRSAMPLSCSAKAWSILNRPSSASFSFAAREDASSRACMVPVRRSSSAALISSARSSIWAIVLRDMLSRTPSTTLAGPVMNIMAKATSLNSSLNSPSSLAESKVLIPSNLWATCSVAVPITLCNISTEISPSYLAPARIAEWGILRAIPSPSLPRMLPGNMSLY